MRLGFATLLNYWEQSPDFFLAILLHSVHSTEIFPYALTFFMAKINIRFDFDMAGGMYSRSE
jgi:hypothetical protein